MCVGTSSKSDVYVTRTDFSIVVDDDFYLREDFYLNIVHFDIFFPDMNQPRARARIDRNYNFRILRMNLYVRGWGGGEGSFDNSF